MEAEMQLCRIPGLNPQSQSSRFLKGFVTGSFKAACSLADWDKAALTSNMAAFEAEQPRPRGYASHGPGPWAPCKMRAIIERNIQPARRNALHDCSL
jgi:hypothetical protein